MSGLLRFEQGVLRYEGRDGPVWSVPAHDLRAIVAYTTDDGPAGEDYFIVFIDHGHSWRSAPLHADGRDAALAALGDALGAPLVLGLANQATWASLGVWPPELAGQPVLDLVHAPPRTWGERLRHWIGLREQQIAVRPSIAARLGLQAYGAAG